MYRNFPKYLVHSTDKPINKQTQSDYPYDAAGSEIFFGGDDDRLLSGAYFLLAKLAVLKHLTQ